MVAVMNRFVVLASDLNPNYTFFVPLTAEAWQRFGYRPLVILVGSAAEWRKNERANTALRYMPMGAKVVFIEIPGRSTATTAQLARLYACSVASLNPNDYLLTSDIDMWPLGPWVGSLRAPNCPVQLYNAGAYSDQPHVQFPICYIGAPVITWRTIVGTQSLSRALDGAFLAMDAARHRWALGEVKEREWDFDERHFGRLVSQWRGFGTVQRINRDMSAPGQRRLDRSCWRVPDSLAGYADAHLLRPGFGKNWLEIRRLWMALGGANWVDAYHRRWMAGKEWP